MARLIVADSKGYLPCDFHDLERTWKEILGII
jgi:hypothetical protein